MSRSLAFPSLLGATLLSVNRPAQLEAQPRVRDSAAVTVASLRSAPDTSKPVSDSLAPAAPRAAAPAASTARAVTPAFGLGSLTIGGEVQVWYVGESGASQNTFRLRRADIRLAGKASGDLSWLIQLDAAKALSVNSQFTEVNGQRMLAKQSVNQASRMLQDASITFTRNNHFAVTAGQFLLPFTLEGSTAVARYETIDQAMFISDRARGGGVAAVRDVGVMASGEWARVLYRVGVFNSSGDEQNTIDSDVQKVVISRVVLRPAPGWDIGASGVYGGEPTLDRARRDRFAVELQYRRHGTLLRGEYVRANDHALQREGWYLHSTVAVSHGLELVGRVDMWDPDRRSEATSASATAHEYLAGLTTTLEGGALKLQLNLSRRQFARNVVPRRDGVAAMAQVAW